MDLLKQRQTLVDYHKTQEKTRGSGWHPADLGALEREQKGELPLSERPVAILDDEDIHFVGPCAATVRAGLVAFIEETETRPATDIIGSTLSYQERVVKVVKRLLKQTGETFILPSREWSSVSAALAVGGIQCAMVGVCAGE